MSILKSTTSGRYKVISDYLKKKYSEIDLWDGRPKVEYDIIEGRDNYTVLLKPKVQGTIVNVNGNEFPCKMIFDNKPYVVFEWFNNPKQFDLIDRHFYINCSHYIFRMCTIKESQEKFLSHNYKHITWSDIFVDENFFTEILPKYNIILSDFIDHMIENNNTLWIKEYVESKEYNFASPVFPRTFTYTKIDNEELKNIKPYIQDFMH